MVEFRAATRCILRRTGPASLLVLGLVASTLISDAAQARRHFRYGFAHPHRARVITTVRGFGRVRPARLRISSGFTPAFSAYAVDGNSGRALFGRDENALRHPASITKVMTLYLLFEQIEKGRLSLDTRIEVSRHAASQSPTKLGLRPGSTIRVEDAIKSIVTKSANDMAVAVAERVGGDEDNFARLMTRKAHALGMARTNFVNASGLPDDRQITTARDLAILGRAIHDRYPRYFRFFSTPSFRYAGQYMANHNHLMEQIEGMDGIKTGYTRSSGFNLLSSVNRNGHWLISVVLGGKTRLGRDRIMADLIEAQIDKCATVRTAPVIAENPRLEHVAEAVPVVQHEGDFAPPVEGFDDEGTEERPALRALRDADGGSPDVAAARLDEPTPAPPPRRLPVIQSPVKVASLATDAPPARARPAFVSGVPRPSENDMTATGSIRPRADRHDGSTSRYIGAATATPSTLKRHPQRDRAEAREKAAPVRVASLAGDIAIPLDRPVATRGSVMIQIGAPPSLKQANELIARARNAGRAALAGARPFTEKVQKGNATLYRARFAGLRPDAADFACLSLRKAGFACFSTKN